jgi:hypothetical protein
VFWSTKTIRSVTIEIAMFVVSMDVNSKPRTTRAARPGGASGPTMR